MTKLFLSSSFVDVSEFLEPFLGEELKNKRITFIPTASVPEEYKAYVTNDRKAFEKLGIIIEELNISNTGTSQIEQVIKKNDFIYISGGNTFYLLQELKTSGADKIILKEIKKGKPYIGASAGSIIMSKNIEYVEKMDDKVKAKNLDDYNALNVVSFYTLPHHTNEPFKKSVEEIMVDYKDKIDLIPISNTEVIQVNGENIKIIGTK
ncbi:peptidase S51 [Tenacibaculum discolor]|uniref:Peptidase S51 n=1 Tax=Tenacibaculum discolor TaxID=361581 RepID=A0A2G1BWP2_9FLAO|nr:Type 1 glutamine amidotransferase-like domain-containing protein [Tenacibaculum discolor]MDP2540475.1 Type 1 glutamine amidotransferase-like domain-containing protein [Tenacibaculum discolor]PHN98436.1 peptidase S51 [Tenacibaculum discolor]